MSSDLSIYLTNLFGCLFYFMTSSKLTAKTRIDVYVINGNVGVSYLAYLCNDFDLS